MSYFQSMYPTDPNTGKQAWVDEFDALRVNNPVRLAGTTFVGSTKDTNFWTETDANGGTVTQGSGIITLATNTTANGSTQYQTVRLARWVPGMENTFRTVLKVGDTGTTNNTRNWGAFSSTDGFYFQLTETTLNIVSLAGSSTYGSCPSFLEWSWSSSICLDTNYHIWEIRMTYADIHFYIDHNLVHTLKPSTTFFSQTLNLNATLSNTNAGGSTTNVNMVIGVAFITRTGPLGTETQYFHGTTAATTTLKYGAGRLHRITMGIVAGGGRTITVYDKTAGSGSNYR